MAIDVMVVRNLRWFLPLLKPVKEVRGGTLESQLLSNPDELNVIASGTYLDPKGLCTNRVEGYK